MAEEKEDGTPPQDAAAKSGLAKEWRRLATWQKTGVVIGGLGLVAGVIYFMNRQSTPTATGNDQTGAMAPGFAGYSGSPNSAYEGYPGSGDQYPPLPSQPTTGGPTQTGPVGTPTPISPPAPVPILHIPGPGPTTGIKGAPGKPYQPAAQRTITPMPGNASPTRTITRQPSPVLGGVRGNKLGVGFSGAPAKAAAKAPAYTPAKAAALQRTIYR